MYDLRALTKNNAVVIIFHMKIFSTTIIIYIVLYLFKKKNKTKKKKLEKQKQYSSNSNRTGLNKRTANILSAKDSSYPGRFVTDEI